ncbi:MAG: hypothetical protein KKA19_07005 [Candidatus Margulisbacteria bacterium]|nr:hypothetical protein [Candidatus Margulisiibacteriota bacterium]
MEILCQKIIADQPVEYISPKLWPALALTLFLFDCSAQNKSGVQEIAETALAIPKTILVLLFTPGIYPILFPLLLIAIFLIDNIKTKEEKIFESGAEMREARQKRLNEKKRSARAQAKAAKKEAKRKEKQEKAKAKAGKGRSDEEEEEKPKSSK